MPSPKPHLPEELISRLKADPMMAGFESSIFSSSFHTEARLRIVNAKDPFSPDDFVCTSVGEKYTYIHLAAMLGDPLLLCEMIRLGAEADIIDAKGYSPLLLALQRLRSCQLAVRMGMETPARLDPSLAWTPASVQRLACVARILIEQHVDVNRAVDGETPLYYACQAQHWEIITLLFDHGVNPSPPSSRRLPVSFLASANDKSRFLTLARENSTGRPRPARPCPCWSGKALSDCHATEQAYPPQFYCKCGSTKVYARCCGRRNMVTFEKWDEAERWIRPGVVRLAGIGVQSGEGTIGQAPKTTQDMVDVLHLSLPQEVLAGETEASPEFVWNFLGQIVIEMTMKGLMDPAYAFAVKETQFLPRPQGRTFDKEACIAAQTKWNHAIDTYISLGTDKRPRANIERAAKIGPSNGALYRTCEGVNCGKLEGKDIDKLVCCSKCKIAVYCGQACQASVWQTHKLECRKTDLREQALPSQKAVDAYAQSSHREEELVDSLTPSAELLALAEAQFPELYSKRS